jgi:hypothetical protein
VLVMQADIFSIDNEGCMLAYGGPSIQLKNRHISWQQKKSTIRMVTNTLFTSAVSNTLTADPSVTKLYL